MTDAAVADIQKEMQELHESLGKTRKRLAELKRKTAKGEIKDYTLLDPAGEPVTLSSLFGDRDDLIVIQNMGKSCPYCTLWADGFTGVQEHLENRAPFVVVSPDAPETQQEFAIGRGWRFRMLSSMDSAFKRDLGFESESGDQMPGISTFARRDGKIINVANDFFGPGDDYCGVWHILDLLEKGADGWEPKFSY